MLVATDKALEAERAAKASAPAVAGAVTIGRESQIVIEPDEEIVRVYYLLSISNPAGQPVNPPDAVSLRRAVGGHEHDDHAGIVSAGLSGCDARHRRRAICSWCDVRAGGLRPPGF